MYNILVPEWTNDQMFYDVSSVSLWIQSKGQGIINILNFLTIYFKAGFIEWNQI